MLPYRVHDTGVHIACIMHTRISLSGPLLPVQSTQNYCVHV